MIRRLETVDIDRVMHIWLTSNIQAHAFISEDYWRTNYEGVKAVLPQAEVWVYEEAQNILGFIGITGDYIEGIFVDETERSKGIGRQLLNAVKLRHTELHLQVYAENRRAITFYKREGFVVQKEQKGETTDAQEYIMTWHSAISREYSTECNILQDTDVPEIKYIT